MENNDFGIVIFDGVCNLCNRFVNFILRKDRKKRFKFSALQSSTGQKLLKDYKLDFSTIDTVIYIKNLKVFTKSSAALHILKDIGGFWKILFVFIIVPKFIRDYCYTFIARNRYRWFGKLDSCMIPTEKDKEMFL